VFIQDRSEKSPKDWRRIHFIWSIIQMYTVESHVQWIKGQLNSTHRKLLTGNENRLTLQFAVRERGYKRYANLKNVKYEGCIGNLFTQIQIHQHKALVVNIALTNLVWKRSPHHILKQMHMLDWTGRGDDDIICIRNIPVRPAVVWTGPDAKSPYVLEQDGYSAIMLRLDGGGRKGWPSMVNPSIHNQNLTKIISITFLAVMQVLWVPAPSIPFMTLLHKILNPQIRLRCQLSGQGVCPIKHVVLSASDVAVPHPDIVSSGFHQRSNVHGLSASPPMTPPGLA
jgi:hypothetical protein